MKSAPSSPSLRGVVLEAFGLIEDPRRHNKIHSIETILFSLLVGILCGADGFVPAEQLARRKRAFIEKYVVVRGDIPTHDTMARLLARLKPEHFASMFATLMERLTGWTAGEILNLDGKTIRAVVGAAMQKFARAEAAERQVHIVSLFSTLNGIFLAQLKTAKSVNEVKAAQELLQFIDIRGTTITADAMHLTTRTFEIIAEQGADAVITVKKQFPSMDKAAERTFRSKKPVMVVTTREPKGRVTEVRVYEIFAAAASPIPTVQSFIRVTRKNVSHSGPKRTKTTTTRYASTHPPERGKFIAECIRKRWHIENRGHYVLDVTFDEDRSRIRTDHSPENGARIRHLAFNLLAVADNPDKLSFATRRAVAAADDDYLRAVLRLPP